MIYDEDFKAKAISLSNEKGVKKAAYDLGVTYNTLLKWRSENKKKELLPKEPFDDNVSDLNLYSKNELAIQLFLESEDPFIAFQNNPCAKTLKEISKNMQTIEMVKAAIKNEKGKYPSILRFVSKTLLTYEVCLEAVRQNGLNLEYVPTPILDKDICYAAITENVKALKYVPEEYILDSTCDYAINIDGLAIAYIPTKYITIERIRSAIENSKYHKYDWPIGHVPRKLMSQELADLSFRLFPESIAAIRGKYLNEDMCKKAVSINGLFLALLPEKYKTRKSIIDKALESNPSALQYVPDRCRTKKRCFDALKKDKDVSTKWFPENIREEYESSQKITDYHLIKLPITPQKKSYELIDEKKDHDLLLKDTEEEIQVYYITDIHIEHQIDINGCQKYEIKNKISKKIQEMLDQHMVEKGLLLIGGDVADSFEVTELFYNTLREYWDGKVIAVLGNHELWDMTQVSINNSVDEIINDYKKMTKDNYTTLLENELLIRYKGDLWEKLSEEQIIKSSEHDLSRLCDCSDIIILGGIGFSGLNPKYNANSGIYNGRLTQAEDISRSNRFNEIYKKMILCAKDKRIVVLTHMPMSNWSKEIYNPNWIYVSGHTHHNNFERTKKGAIILSDNQIGYEQKKWALKKFVYDEMCFNNIFKDVKDGIYKISREEYMSFNRDIGVGLWNFKRRGQIFLLKKEGHYMFVLRNKDLYLLEGGNIHTLYHDLNYYYNNLSNYCKQVNKAFSKYYSYLKIISEEIQKFGGSGKIHGCIVDINFYNHIYVNPLDGKVTPYFALNTYDKCFYHSIPDLLRDSPYAPEINSGESMLFKYEDELKKGNLPVLCSFDMDENISLAKIPEIIIDREMYKPSNFIMKFQYILEQETVRVWRDDILNASFENDENKVENESNP